MDHSAHPAVAMGLSGLVLAAVVPGVVRLTRYSPLWRRSSVPAVVALPLLVVLHAWVVLGDPLRLPPPGGALPAETALVVAAVLFWLPVLAGTRHRLSDPGRCLYLFLAAPLLDLPAVGVVAAGRPAEGLAMIVGMLPVGIAAAAVTWSWANREERSAAVLPPDGGAYVP
ncbi:hypothetical protein ACF09J_27990 [Streptomyces sp. NPDC014889]|uniref:hypothetical protein n=1 Tax=Streptomyces sp. NPDC014889 TaxID=3364928 RepID=UPI003701EE3E